MKMRVVIIDDDPDVRNELQHLLETYHPDFEVVASVDDPALALQQIEAGEIDVACLDINFEEKGHRLGLEFARRISRLPHAPFIIFITNYPSPENMLEAFPSRPYGFITKPIELSNLEEALDRIQRELDRLRKDLPESSASVNTLEVRYHIFRAPPDGGTLVERVFITRFLAPKEIKYIQSNQGVNTVKVYLLNGEVLDHVTRRLNQWLNLNLPCFVQISRNAVVHMKYASGYKSDPSRFDAHLLTFKDCPTELPIGQVYFPAFREALRIGGDCCK